MRDPKRINMITILFFNIWSKYPDMRFGQLYENLLHVYFKEKDIAYNPRMIWNVEDSDFELFLQNFEGFK